MIARLLGLVLLPLALAAAPAPRDWSRTVARESDGAFSIGNPAAKVTLVEYLSYTCPHCAKFSADSAATLAGGWLRRGVVRLTVRHAIRDKADLTAAIVARCAGPRMVEVNGLLLAGQATWVPKLADAADADQAAAPVFAALGGTMAALEAPGVAGARRAQLLGQLQPLLDRLRGYAVAAGFDTGFAAQGISRPRFAACFRDTADLVAVLRMTKAAWAAIKGTPSFVVNGAPVPDVEWSTLEPKLRAAGAG